MKAFEQHEPLTDAELNRLGVLLENIKGGQAMNLEELDGFFSALIAGPEVVPPSEYLPEIFGGEMSETVAFKDLDQANDIMGLLMRHWNTIAATLHKDDVYLPILLEDENGVCMGNDWARGFMRGTEYAHDAWGELINDEEHAGAVIPILALYHEHDEDPEMRPEPISPERRETIIIGMAAGLVGAYRYFRPERQHTANAAATSTRGGVRKIGRNQPCPCGSGKKYKRCCGGTTVH